MIADDQDFILLDATDVRDFNEEGTLPISSDQLTEIKQWLAPTDYAAPWSEYGKHLANHLRGTGLWIRETAQFKQWHERDGGALWIKAVAGAGKSVVAASLISALTEESSAPVLYFFFRRIISANQTPRSLIRDCLTQILEHCPQLQHDLYQMVEQRRVLDTLSTDDLWKLLISTCALLPRVYILIDAMDEMIDEQEVFLQHLVQLIHSGSPSIKVLMTGRPIPYLETYFRHPDILQIALRPELVYSDIALYITHRLKGFNIRENLRTQVHDIMLNKAAGHFLYARLMLDELLSISQASDSREEDVLAATSNLPDPMADMYTMMLTEHSRRSGISQSIQIEILQWVTKAERPVRLLELSHLVDLSQRAFIISKDQKQIIREACGPLLEIFEDETVNPIHHSFTEYLYDERRSSNPSNTLKFPVLNAKEAHYAIATSCLRLLTSPTWWKKWLDTRAGGSPSTADDVRDIRNFQLTYPFLAYTANNWHRHLLQSEVTNASSLRQVESLLESADIRTSWLEIGLKRNDEKTEKDSSTLLRSWTPLHAAADVGLAFYINHLVRQGCDVQVSDLHCRTPLNLAASHGHYDAVSVLLKAGAQPDNRDRYGRYALRDAAKRDYHRVTQVLLESGASPSSIFSEQLPIRWTDRTSTKYASDPLASACEFGHVKTMRTFLPYLDTSEVYRALLWAFKSCQPKVAMALLETPGVDVDYYFPGHGSLLYLATRSRDFGCMRRLLAMGANGCSPWPETPSDSKVVNSESKIAQKPSLFQSLVLGRGRRAWNTPVLLEGLEILLNAGLDPNMADATGSTVLHTMVGLQTWQVKGQSREDVQRVLLMLFEKGLLATTSNTQNENALHVMSNVPVSMVDFFIDLGLDINQRRNKDGQSPLLANLKRFRGGFAGRLLVRGADAQLADYNGNTALHLLAKQSEKDFDPEMLETLVSAGANINQRNKQGQTPLHVATIHSKLLACYLKHGADLEIKDALGETALFKSCSTWVATKPYTLLVEAGADIHTSNAKGLTILHCAMENLRSGGTRCVEKLEFFVQRTVNPLATDFQGNNLWHLLAQHIMETRSDDLLLTMSSLVKYGVCPTARNNLGRTALHTACSIGKFSSSNESFHFFMEKVNPVINAADVDDVRPIHLAAAYSAYMTAYLLEHGADPTLLTKDRQSPLTIACRYKRSDVVYLLLAYFERNGKCTLINAIDKDGRTALHYACRSGMPEVVGLLLKAGANTEIRDAQGRNPLDACAEYSDHQEEWKKANDTPGSALVGREASVLMVRGKRPAVNSDRPQPARIRQIIRMIVANKLDSASSATQGLQIDANAMRTALNKCSEAMVSELCLLLRRFPPNLDVVSKPDDLLLSDFASGGCISDIVRTLPRHESLSLSDRLCFLRLEQRTTFLATIVRPSENNIDLIRHLLEEDDEPGIMQLQVLGADFLMPDITGNNPLYLMAKWGFTDLLREFLPDARKMNARWARAGSDAQGPWALEFSNGILYTALVRPTYNMEMVKLLVQEADFGLEDELLDRKPNEDPRQYSYLHLLARPSHWWQLEALDFFLSRGANIEALDSDLRTPLLAALEDRPTLEKNMELRQKAVKILLEHGANANATDKDSRTCLGVAWIEPIFVHLLLQYGADPSCGSRPFIFDAIKCQDLGVLRTLLDIGIDLNVLCSASPRQAVKNDLVGDSNIHAKASPKQHPVVWSRMNSAEDLIAHAYPIHVAASSFFQFPQPEKRSRAVQIVEMLLAAGASPFLEYADGLSVLHVLAEQGGVLEPFMKLPSIDIEMRDAGGRTILLAVCDAGPSQYSRLKAEMLQSFLKCGPSLVATDHRGRNALHCLLMAPTPTFCEEGRLPMFPPAVVSALTPESDNQGRTPFHYALSADRFHVIDLLLQHGANPTIPDPRDGCTALHHLAKGLPHWTDLLVHESDSILRTEDVTETDGNPAEDYYVEFEGRTVHVKYVRLSDIALWKLCSPRRHFEALLAIGLPINGRDQNGETALFKLMEANLLGSFLSRGRPPSMLAALKVFDRAGADFCVRNHEGQGVLHKLASRSNLQFTHGSHEVLAEDLRQTFRWLVAQGVDLTWEDTSSRTCLDVAAASGSQWILDMYKRDGTASM